MAVKWICRLPEHTGASVFDRNNPISERWELDDVSGNSLQTLTNLVEKQYQTRTSIRSFLKVYCRNIVTAIYAWYRCAKIFACAQYARFSTLGVSQSICNYDSIKRPKSHTG